MNLIPYCSCAFREARCTLKGINEILPLIYAHFFPLEYLHKNLLSDGVLREKRCTDSHTLLKDINEFLSILST